MRPILRAISFHVESGEIVSLVGGNAAGKTSTLRAIVGLAKQASGQIQFEGRPIVGIEPKDLLRLGIAFCASERQIFPEMSVFENLEMGAYIFGRERGSEFEASLERIFSLFATLKERLHQRAGTLSGGEQKMLAVARALMARPKMLLLDEPSLGLSPEMVARFGDAVLDLNNQGMTLLIAEQNRSLAIALSDRIYQLERGEIVAEGDRIN
jgi:branched-chain amino acid transport system ATP-binding protein